MPHPHQSVTSPRNRYCESRVLIDDFLGSVNMKTADTASYLSYERGLLPPGPLLNLPVLALISDRDAETTVLRAARRIAASMKVGLAVLRAYLLSKRLSEVVRSFTAGNRISKLICDWPSDPDELQAVLRCVVTRNIAAVVIRAGQLPQSGRVLIPTGGGIHTIEQLWVAREFAAEFGLAMQSLHIAEGGVRLAREEMDSQLNSGVSLRHAQLQARIAGVTGPVLFHTAPSVVSGIEACAFPNDLIVLGAPNYWRVAEHFRGSIPELLSRRLNQPMAMLVARQSQRLQLREVLWNRTICLNLRPRNKQDAIRLLIQALAANDQVPKERQDELLEIAMSREAEASTAVDCETAFPHITIPDFPGVIGCLGICPDGVQFNEHEEPTKFVFLLITPREHYDEYMGILARIAQLMVLPTLRASLLACRTVDEAIKVLDLGPVSSELKQPRSTRR